MMSRGLQPAQDAIDKRANGPIRRISSYDPYEKLHAQMTACIKRSLSPTRKESNDRNTIFSHSVDSGDDEDEGFEQLESDQEQDELEWEDDNHKSEPHVEEELISFRTDLIVLEDTIDTDTFSPTAATHTMPTSRSLSAHSLLLHHQQPSFEHLQPQSITDTPDLERFNQHIPTPINYEDIFRQHLSYAESRMNMELNYLSSISHTRQVAAENGGVDGMPNANGSVVGLGLHGFVSNLIRDQMAYVRRQEALAGKDMDGINGNCVDGNGIDSGSDEEEPIIDDIPAACE